MPRASMLLTTLMVGCAGGTPPVEWDAQAAESLKAEPEAGFPWCRR